MSKNSKGARKDKTRYSRKMVAIASEAAGYGANNGEIAEIIGCDACTLYRWMKTHEEFADAIYEARKPKDQAEALARHAERQRLYEEWCDEYVRNKGTIVEVCEGTGGAGSYKKVRRGAPPDLKIIDRILGTRVEPEEFKLTISIAEPEPDLDDDDFDEEELDENDLD